VKSRSMRYGRAFGRVLRHYRKLAGLSQEQLAEIADLDRTYPSLLERGLRIPTLTVIFVLARAVGIHPTQMVEEVERELRRQ